jgi:radical SAM superfamily enzyme YgiQ (UPF0313 family)
MQANDRTSVETTTKSCARLDSLGVMINGSFVFGLDGDSREVFRRTVDWAVGAGIMTATFHILTPYPGTALFSEKESRQRIETRNGICTTRGTSSIDLHACRLQN